MEPKPPIPWRIFYALYGVGLLCALLETLLIAASLTIQNNPDVTESFVSLLFLAVYIPLLILPFMGYLLFYGAIVSLSLLVNFLISKAKRPVRISKGIILFLPPLLIEVLFILPITLSLYYQQDSPLSQSDIGTAAHIANWGIIGFYVIGITITYVALKRKKPSKTVTESPAPKSVESPIKTTDENKTPTPISKTIKDANGWAPPL